MQTVERSPIYLGPKVEQLRFKLRVLAQAYMAQFAQEIEEPKQARIQRFTLDLSDTDEYDFTDDMKLKQELSKRGLYSKQFGYSAFPTFLSSRAVKMGTYYDPKNNNANEMWCCRISGNDGKIKAYSGSLVDYLTGNSEDKRTCCFAIYDLNQMKLADLSDGDCFVFKDPQNKKAALKAIVLVKLN